MPASPNKEITASKINKLPDKSVLRKYLWYYLRWLFNFKVYFHPDFLGILFMLAVKIRVEEAQAKCEKDQAATEELLVDSEDLVLETKIFKALDYNDWSDVRKREEDLKIRISAFKETMAQSEKQLAVMKKDVEQHKKEHDNVMTLQAYIDKVDQYTREIFTHMKTIQDFQKDFFLPYSSFVQAVYAIDVALYDKKKEENEKILPKEVAATDEPKKTVEEKILQNEITHNKSEQVAAVDFGARLEYVLRIAVLVAVLCVCLKHLLQA